MSDIKKLLILIVAFLAVIMVSFGVGKRWALDRLVSPQEARVDTLFIFDTIVSEKPVFREKKVIEKSLVRVTDTLRVRDTLYMYAEREQIHWKDSLSDVYASGIEVEVDSVLHYVPRQIITKEREVLVKVKPRWSLGVHAGYGVQFGEQVRSAPYVGIGISYNLFSW